GELFRVEGVPARWRQPRLGSGRAVPAEVGDADGLGEVDAVGGRLLDARKAQTFGRDTDADHGDVAVVEVAGETGPTVRELPDASAHGHAVDPPHHPLPGLVPARVLFSVREKCLDETIGARDLTVGQREVDQTERATERDLGERIAATGTHRLFVPMPRHAADAQTTFGVREPLS